MPDCKNAGFQQCRMSITSALSMSCPPSVANEEHFYFSAYLMVVLGSTLPSLALSTIPFL
ncbi:hypothetical protein [Chryseobacterium taeanense]|uniref:hypothetical protein n=1 Tax=Chryseobacterium taeanense TaxID=311334 RepID=UPI0035AFAE99